MVADSHGDNETVFRKHIYQEIDAKAKQTSRFEKKKLGAVVHRPKETEKASKDIAEAKNNKKSS